VIGTGVPTSVNEIYRALVDVTGFAAPVTHAPRRPGDAREVYFNPAKALRELGWRAETSLLEACGRRTNTFATATAPPFERRLLGEAQKRDGGGFGRSPKREGFGFAESTTAAGGGPSAPAAGS